MTCTRYSIYAVARKNVGWTRMATPLSGGGADDGCTWGRRICSRSCASTVFHRRDIGQLRHRILAVSWQVEERGGTAFWEVMRPSGTVRSAWRGARKC